MRANVCSFIIFRKVVPEKRLGSCLGLKDLDLHPDKIISRLGAVDAALAI